MVHLGSSEGRQRPRQDKVAVKLEMEDTLDDEYGPFNKKRKQSSSPNQVATSNTIHGDTPSEYNPLSEPSPLGLRLRKSPSLLELIQMRLTQSTSTPESVCSDNLESQVIGNTKGSAPSGTADKLKASNFPASLLRIGCWEYASRYEGDLVAKCYFAKHKLVWEVLDGGLKSKIEIQWSDIVGLKSDFRDNAPATLVVVLARQPLFFRETNPQPRKHTLWQATTDFTDGQASMHRKHYLEVPYGLLNKHFEKLIQCDMRLNFLSQQLEMTLDSPFFEKHISAFEDSNVCKNNGIDQRESNKSTSFSIIEDVATPSVSQSSSITVKQEDALQCTSEIMSHEAPSPSSVMDTGATGRSSGDEYGELKGSKSFEKLIMQGLRPSMSMTDLVNHIGNCISEQMSSENPKLENEGQESRQMLEDIAQHLLSDFQFTPYSDEKSLMSRVNSFCSLLQKDGTPIQSFEVCEKEKDAKIDSHDPDLGDEDEIAGSEGGGCKQASSSMRRIDSYGDLLLHLPRIASLPKLLFDISEDGENQAW